MWPGGRGGGCDIAILKSHSLSRVFSSENTLIRGGVVHAQYTSVVNILGRDFPVEENTLIRGGVVHAQYTF
jgi:hypothetical protein